MRRPGIKCWISFVLKNNPYGASTSGLVVQGADNLVLSGVLSDVGRLTKNGSGTLTLTADNTYTGGRFSRAVLCLWIKRCGLAAAI
ncbi:predicted protein [Brucella melitensis bv. 3 str. Ether]|nr:autotransporter-associated beta strand repeat-containing protein [Brucella melitensis]EEZ10274.1 predicted protein [Brucella melitensis bv. 3 str. Ether]